MRTRGEISRGEISEGLRQLEVRYLRAMEDSGLRQLKVRISMVETTQGRDKSTLRIFKVK